MALTNTDDADLNANANSGIRLLNFPASKQAEDTFTIVVSGLGRSGTSMAAHMLSLGGVSMGVSEGDVIHEDLSIATLIETGDRSRLESLVARRNERHEVWGFKRPLVVKHTDILMSALRQPRFILLFRDPLSVAIRNEISMAYPIRDALDVYFEQSKTVMSFIRKCSAPIMMASYEKALLDPELFAAKLAKFCNIPQDRIKDMAMIIKPNSANYLEATIKK